MGMEKIPKPRKNKKKTTPVSQQSTVQVGIRKTRLMELAEGYGDTGLMNPRSVDPLVYMLAEMGESAFGKSVINNCQEDIALSNAGFPKKKAIGYLADQVIRKYLAHEFQTSGKPDVSGKLKRMPVLNEASYVDYFMTVSMLERDAFRTSVHQSANDMVKLITGYQTESPGQVCDAIINFFKTTKNQAGFEDLLRSLCVLVKTKQEAMHHKRTNQPR
jgi:hypothetical protein